MNDFGFSLPDPVSIKRPPSAIVEKVGVFGVPVGLDGSRFYFSPIILVQVSKNVSVLRFIDIPVVLTHSEHNIAPFAVFGVNLGVFVLHALFHFLL